MNLLSCSNALWDILNNLICSQHLFSQAKQDSCMTNFQIPSFSGNPFFSSLNSALSNMWDQTTHSTPQVGSLLPCTPLLTMITDLLHLKLFCLMLVTVQFVLLQPKESDGICWYLSKWWCLYTKITASTAKYLSICSNSFLQVTQNFLCINILPMFPTLLSFMLSGKFFSLSLVSLTTQWKILLKS